jgi:hypothetical protein
MEYDKLYLMTKFFLLSKPRILDVDSFPPFRADFFLNHIKFTSYAGIGPLISLVLVACFSGTSLPPTPSWRFTKTNCKGKQFTTEHTINGRSLYW